MTNLNKKILGIKLLATDVDGVLTDGGMYYTSKGDIMKKFHTRDGMGVTLLKKNKIPTIIITKERNLIIKQWAKKMNVSKIYDGVKKKEVILSTICKEFDIKTNEIAYIGDDINDIKLLEKVGFSATPNDGIKFVQDFVDYVCSSNGGKGALREIADLILINKKSNMREWY